MTTDPTTTDITTMDSMTVDPTTNVFGWPIFTGQMRESRAPGESIWSLHPCQRPSYNTQIRITTKISKWQNRD